MQPRSNGKPSRCDPGAPGLNIHLIVSRCVLCATVVLWLFSIALPAFAQTTAPTAAAPAAAPSEEAVRTLKMLQDRDQTLKDFTAQIRYEVYHPRTDDTTVQKGDMSYLKQEEITKLAAHFTLEGASGEFTKVDHTLVFDGRWFIDCNSKDKIFHKTQVVPPDSKIKPLKLGEGPLPLPIGQDTGKVLHDFVVSVEPVDPKMKDAADIVHLKLVPRSKELSKAYDMSNLEIWSNKKLELPVKLLRESLDQNITTIKLDEIKVNQGAAKIFDLPTPQAGDGWDVRVETLEKKGTE